MDEYYCISKKQIYVELLLKSGEVLNGYMFVQTHERVIDLLNDARDFIPLEFHPDDTVLIQKQSIEKIEEKSSRLTRPHELANLSFGAQVMSPEEAEKVLGLGKECTKEEIDQAFERILFYVHPDLGGSTYLAAKVNAARDVLVKARKSIGLDSAV